MKGAVRIAVAGGLLLAVEAGALTVSHVYHEPAIAEPGSEVVVHLRLSEPASVALEIYDGRDVRIRRIESGEVLGAGDHQIAWDLDDFAERPVPPEAYTYAIEAEPAAGGGVVRWDLARTTGGKPVSVDSLSWDPARGTIRYSVPELARVRVRTGLANDGPLLKTVVDWAARAPGVHEEPWDGRDLSGLIDVSNHPELLFGQEAFSLPQNAVIVTRAPSGVALIEDLPEPRVQRPELARREHQMYDYPNQAIETRRDYAVDLRIGGSPARTKEGLPIVHGPVPVRLSVASSLLSSIEAERAEIVFFVDGRFAFENQVGFLPFTWTWDPGGVVGVHYITANVRGYDGHFGIQTVKVLVAPKPDER